MSESTSKDLTTSPHFLARFKSYCVPWVKTLLHRLFSRIHRDFCYLIRAGLPATRPEWALHSRSEQLKLCQKLLLQADAQILKNHILCMYRDFLYTSRMSTAAHTRVRNLLDVSSAA